MNIVNPLQAQHHHALLCQDEVAAVNDVIEELQGTLAATELKRNIGKQFTIPWAPLGMVCFA